MDSYTDETMSINRIGARSSGNYWNGGVSDCWIANRQFSDAEHAEWHAGPEPLNVTSPVLATDGTVTSGTWDTQGNGTISRTTYLRLASDDSLIATLYVVDPDFSTYVTGGETYYVVERASNDGGYDDAEDTPSADATIAGGGSSITGFRLGGTTINKMYLGSTEIKKAYLGSTLIYDKTV